MGLPEDVKFGGVRVYHVRFIVIVDDNLNRFMLHSCNRVYLS